MQIARPLDWIDTNFAQTEVGLQSAVVAAVHAAAVGMAGHRTYCSVYGYQLARMVVEEGIAALLCLGMGMSFYVGIDKQLEGK